MLSMILQRYGPESDQRIHLCAPSNGAVDQILQKVLVDGLLGFPSDRCKQLIVRVGASNYKAPEELNCIELNWII